MQELVDLDEVVGVIESVTLSHNALIVKLDGREILVKLNHTSLRLANKKLQLLIGRRVGLLVFDDIESTRTLLIRNAE